MGKVLAIANQKGGVGKTTTAINLTASLVSLNRRALLIDLDPQGNATMGCGINKKELINSINEALLGEIEVRACLLSTRAGFDILPANRDLTEAEVKLLQMSRREYRLLQLVAKLRDSYDFIIIDCPPSLNMLTLNSLVAADGVVIPMQCEYYALEGLSGLLETIEQLHSSLNPRLHVAGILRTMFDGRTSLTNDVSEQLTTHFPDKVYNTIIPRNVRLAEAPSFGMPVLIYDKRSPGALAYLSLAQEVVDRFDKAAADTFAELATA